MKVNWGVSMIVVYTIFAASMVIFAINASKQKNDLVTENYYDEAVKYQNRIEEQANAASVSSKLNINYDATVKSVNLTASGAERKIAGTLTFYKPDKASIDFSVPFSTDEEGIQKIAVQKLAHGYWMVTANYTVEGKNCSEEERIFIP